MEFISFFLCMCGCCVIVLVFPMCFQCRKCHIAIDFLTLWAISCQCWRSGEAGFWSGPRAKQPNWALLPPRSLPWSTTEICKANQNVNESVKNKKKKLLFCMFTSSVQLCNLVDGNVNVSAWFQTGWHVPLRHSVFFFFNRLPLTIR